MEAPVGVRPRVPGGGDRRRSRGPAVASRLAEPVARRALQRGGLRALGRRGGREDVGGVPPPPLLLAPQGLAPPRHVRLPHPGALRPARVPHDPRLLLPLGEGPRSRRAEARHRPPRLLPLPRLLLPGRGRLRPDAPPRRRVPQPLRRRAGPAFRRPIRGPSPARRRGAVHARLLRAAPPRPPPPPPVA